MYKHTTRKLGLKREFVLQFSRLLSRLGDHSHNEVAKAIGRDRSTVEKWLKANVAALPDWADLRALQAHAARKGVLAEFFKLVGQTQDYELRMELPARTGALAAILVRIFHDGGSVLSLSADVDENTQRAAVALVARLPGAADRLEKDLGKMVDHLVLQPLEVKRSGRITPKRLP